MATQTSHDLNVVTSFEADTLTAVATAIVAHVNNLNQVEIAARGNADTYNLQQLQEFVALATARMNLIEDKADTLTGGEFGQLEDVILQILSQPGFASLLSGLSITIGGTAYSMTSVVNALATAAQISSRTQANVIDGVPRTLTVFTNDGMSFVFSATETVTPAVVDAETGAVLEPKKLTYSYGCADFQGVPAAQIYVYAAKPLAVAGLSLNVEAKSELSRTYILLDLAGKFVASTPTTLHSPDLNGDTFEGTAAPLAAAMAALAAAIAARDLKTGELASANAAVVTAQDTSDDLAAVATVARQDSNTAALALANAQAAASVSVPAAEQVVADATQDLADANTSGIQQDIDDATAALAAANAALADIHAGVAALQSLFNSADAAAVAAEAAAAGAADAVVAAGVLVTDATAALAAAEAEVLVKQAAVDALQS